MFGPRAVVLGTRHRATFILALSVAIRAFGMFACPRSSVRNHAASLTSSGRPSLICGLHETRNHLYSSKVSCLVDHADPLAHTRDCLYMPTVVLLQTFRFVDESVHLGIDFACVTIDRTIAKPLER